MTEASIATGISTVDKDTAEDYNPKLTCHLAKTITE